MDTIILIANYRAPLAVKHESGLFGSRVRGAGSGVLQFLVTFPTILLEDPTLACGA